MLLRRQRIDTTHPTETVASRKVPGGYLTKRYGGKAILGLSFLLWAPLSGVLAATTRSGYAVGIVVACRLGIGLAQGILLPAAQSVLGHWTPAKDRGRHFAFAMSGMFAGAAIAMVTVPSVGAWQEEAGRGGGLRSWVVVIVALDRNPVLAL